MSGQVMTLGGGGGSIGELLDVQFARKTGDESVSNATFQDDNELSFPVAANTTWAFRIVLVYTAAASATVGRLKTAVTVPSGTTLQLSTLGKAGNETTNAGSFATGTASASGVTTGICGGAGATLMHAVIDGIVIVGSTPGTVQLQWAQQTTDATATIVKANSFLVAHRVG